MEDMEFLYFLGGAMLIMIFLDNLLNVTVSKELAVTIVSHSFSVDKNGNRAYATILKREDGIIEESLDLKYYVLEVGSKSTIMKYYRQRRKFSKNIFRTCK